MRWCIECCTNVLKIHLKFYWYRIIIQNYYYLNFDKEQTIRIQKFIIICLSKNGHPMNYTIRMKTFYSVQK